MSTRWRTLRFVRLLLQPSTRWRTYFRVEHDTFVRQQVDDPVEPVLRACHAVPNGTLDGTFNMLHQGYSEYSLGGDPGEPVLRATPRRAACAYARHGARVHGGTRVSATWQKCTLVARVEFGQLLA